MRLQSILKILGVNLMLLLRKIWSFGLNLNKWRKSKKLVFKMPLLKLEKYSHKKQKKHQLQLKLNKSCWKLERL